MQKGVARLRQMNPPWEYRPTRHYEDGAGNPCTDWERAYFAFVTHDGDKARGGIEYIDHWAHHCFWKLTIRINDLPMLEVEVRASTSAWVDVLEPYFNAIPAVVEWRRQCATREARRLSENQTRDQQAAALKQKYGL